MSGRQAVEATWIRRWWVSGGLIVLAATLLNELLMGLVPKGPLWWAIPYFPLRAVGIPFLCVVQLVLSARALIVGPGTSQRLVAVAGVMASVAAACFNWFYNDLLFFRR